MSLQVRSSGLVLHVAPEAGYGMGERRMDFDPVRHELLVRPAGLAREQADGLDHGSSSL
jgi:hypothetical protein